MIGPAGRAQRVGRMDAATDTRPWPSFEKAGTASPYNPKGV
jgi:hypothetical protein